MTQQEQNQFVMMKAVYHCLTINVLLICNNDSLMKGYNKLKSQIKEIDVHLQAQLVCSKVILATRAIERQYILDKVFIILDGIGAYGISIDDNYLKMASKVKLANLIKLGDEDFLLKIRAIYEVAYPIASNLEIWGVDIKDIELLENMPLNYIAKTKKNNKSKAKKKQASIILKKSFYDTNCLLKSSINPLMYSLKRSNPLFYQQYLISRKIINVSANTNVQASSIE